MKRSMIIVLLGLLVFSATSAEGQQRRTVQDIQAETSARNRELDQATQAMPKIPVFRTDSQSAAVRLAFRNKILQTMTEQKDLKVTKIIDGDTVEVGSGSRKSTLHIIGVDAPEEGQPGWEEAKTALSNLLLDKNITIKYSTFCPKHHSGVFLTRVMLDGEDVGTYLLKNGMAWYDEAYEVFFDEKEHKENLKLAKTAHAAKLGIWKNGEMMEPWKYAEVKGKTTP